MKKYSLISYTSKEKSRPNRKMEKIFQETHRKLSKLPDEIMLNIVGEQGNGS